MSFQDPEAIRISEVDQLRQAIRPLGGYLYQLYQTLQAWLQLPEHGTLFLEVAEDYMEVLGDAVKQVQIRDTYSSGNITLRSDGVLELIASHLRLQNENRSKKVISIYLTTSLIGTEKSYTFPGKKAGLDYWRLATIEDLDVEPIKTFLLNSNLNADAKKCIEHLSESDFRQQVLKSISWVTSEKDLPEIRKSILNSLVFLGREKGISSFESERTLDIFICELLRIIVETKERKVDKADLYRVFDNATKISISRTLFENLLSSSLANKDFASFLPSLKPIFKLSEIPLPSRRVLRREIVSALSKDVENFQCLWLHGSNGLGKTILAQLIGKNLEGDWYFLDFRNSTSDEIVQRFTEMAKLVKTKSVRGIILDDYSRQEATKTFLELLVFVNACREGNTFLVITASQPPTSEFKSRLGTDGLKVEEVPYLTEKDVEELVSLSGGDPRIWTEVIYLFSGNGHPQIVDARILGLKTRGWPIEELITEADLVDGGAKEVQELRDETMERLAKELPPEARRLLYRLTLTFGEFDYKCVMAIASTSPEIEMPGEKFRYLQGPWIEVRAEDSYTVSPLISFSGQRNLGPKEQSFVRKSIIEDLLTRRPFPGHRLNQLLLAAFAEKDSTALRWFAEAIMVNFLRYREDFRLLAQTLSSFVFFRTDIKLFSSDSHISAMLRIAQFFIATEIESSRASEIFDCAIAECREIKNSTLSASLILMLTAKLLMSRRGNISPLKWFPLIADFESLMKSAGEIGPSLGKIENSSDMIDWTPQEFLFVCQASSIATVADLSDLFSALNNLESTDRMKFLNALDKGQHGLRQMIDSSWLNESKKEALDGKKAAEVFGNLAKIASSWSHENLEIDCICAQVVMLDEYSNQSDKAQELLENALKKFGAIERLLRRKQLLLFRASKFKESLSVFPNILTALEDNLVDKAFALRDAGICAYEIGDFSFASEIFQKAATTTFLCDKSMHSMAVGFLADASLSEFLQHNYSKSLNLSFQALIKAEKENPESSIKARYLWIALGYLNVTIWQVGRGKIRPDSLEVKPGEFSNPEPAPKTLSHPYVPPIMQWYMLALGESFFGTEKYIFEYLRQKLGDIGYLPFESFLSDAWLGVAAKEGNIDFFLAELPRNLELIRISKLLNSTIDVREPLEVKITQGPPNEWANQNIRTYFIQAILIFAICALANGKYDDINALINSLEQHFSGDSEMYEFLQIFKSEGAWTSTDDVPKLIANVVVLARNFDGKMNSDALLRINYYVWAWLRQTLLGSYVENLVADYFSRCWKRLIDECRFQLCNPSMTVPEIQSILESDAVGSKRLALLALAGSSAVTNQLPAEIRKELRDYISS